MRNPYREDWLSLILSIIHGEPGLWTARICRLLNSIPETRKGVMHCGRCKQYANPRKQARAKKFAAQPTFEDIEPEWQLHAACKAFNLKQVQAACAELEEATMIYGQREQIPDLNGWGRNFDYGTRWYVQD
jgi:hypothetical protein